MPNPDLTVKIVRLTLKNPVIVSSGTFGFGREFEDFFDLNQFGALISKGISLTPMEGNPPPRIFETEGGILNSIGLQNPGVEAFIKNKLPYYRDLKTHLIVNFFGNTRKEYVEFARRFDHVPGISALEMNISCPNTKRGGIVFGTDPQMAHRLVQVVRKVTTLTLIVKLSPNVTDIGLMAKSGQTHSRIFRDCAGPAPGIRSIRSLRSRRIVPPHIGHSLTCGIAPRC